MDRAEADIRLILTPSQAHTVEAAYNILTSYGAVLLTQATGTGKTFMAAALAARYTASGRSAAAVVPAHLRAMWKSVFMKFGLRIPVFSYQQASLGRLPAVKQSDMLWVMDEAHMLKNTTAKCHEVLRHHTAHHRVCLITATPTTGRLRDLYALALICGYPPGAAYDAPEFVVSFLRALMPESETGAVVPPAPSDIQTLDYDTEISKAESETAELIREIQMLTWPVAEPDGTFEDASIVTQVLMHRLFSHRTSCLSTMQKLEKYYRSARSDDGGALITRREFYRLAGVTGNQRLFPFAQHLCGTKIPDAERPTLEKSLSCLQKSIILLKKLCAGPDCALEAVQKIIDAIPDGRSVVLFSQYADTAEYYAKHLRGSGPVALLTAQKSTYNGIGIDRRIVEAMFDPAADAPRQFYDAGYRRASILVCSDAFACGHNLHRACCLIHLDLPWMPSGIRQREGRILRIGQTAPVVTFYRPVYRNLPGALAVYQAHHLKTLKTRSRLLGSWHCAKPRFDEILIIKSDHFPAHWARCRGRWIPIDRHDARTAENADCRQSTFSRAFAAMTAEAARDISQEWKYLKSFADFNNISAIAPQLIAYVRAAGVFPKYRIQRQSNSVFTAEQCRTRLEEKLAEIRTIPPLSIPEDSAPCEIYTNIPQIPPELSPK